MWRGSARGAGRLVVGLASVGSRNQTAGSPCGAGSMCHPTTRGTDKDHCFTAVAKLLGKAGVVDDDHVLAAPADVGVLAKSALQQIVTRSADQLVIPSPTAQDVIAFQTANAVRRGGAADVVSIRGALDLVPRRGQGRASEQKDSGQDGVPHATHHSPIWRSHADQTAGSPCGAGCRCAQ